MDNSEKEITINFTGITAYTDLLDILSELDITKRLEASALINKISIEVYRQGYKNGVDEFYKELKD
jgi:hypothetical protein